MYHSTKTYGPEMGLSACFRQWRADSHCRFFHGYPLAITLKFSTTTLDSRGWVVDFGGLKPLKEHLVQLFDHKTLVAKDDPQLKEIMRLDDLGIVDLVVLDHVGCEAFAQHVHGLAVDVLKKIYVPNLLVAGVTPPEYLFMNSVEVREHGGNSALYEAGTLITGAHHGV